MRVFTGIDRRGYPSALYAKPADARQARHNALRRNPLSYQYGLWAQLADD